MNHVVKVIKHCAFFLYADDLAIVVSGKDVDILRSLLQEDINNIYDWCYANVLTVNIKKTQVLWCYPVRNPPVFLNCDILLSNDILKRVSHFNYLGVIIDHDLSFKNQCNNVW